MLLLDVIIFHHPLFCARSTSDIFPLKYIILHHNHLYDRRTSINDDNTFPKRLQYHILQHVVEGFAESHQQIKGYHILSILSFLHWNKHNKTLIRIMESFLVSSAVAALIMRLDAHYPRQWALAMNIIKQRFLNINSRLDLVILTNLKIFITAAYS